MEIVNFLYNIFLLILYSVALCYAVTMYLHDKKTVYLTATVLFLFYILDNIIIYMTEFIDSFSVMYDLQFMSVPAFKTVIITTTCACLLLFQREFLPSRSSRGDVIALILLVVTLLFVPMLQDSAFKIWLYYLPCQIFTFYLSLSGLHHLKKNPELPNQRPFLVHYRWILRMTVLFSVLILIEDTIVIFSFDVYTNLLVKINNRSLSEDVLSILYALFALRHLTAALWRAVPVAQPVQTPPEPIDPVASELLPTPPTAPPQVASGGNTVPFPRYSTELDPVFYQFALDYRLTAREQDILRILLQDKNNQEISEMLFISVGTVKTHVHNIFQKTDVIKRSQLLRLYDSHEGNFHRANLSR